MSKPSENQESIWDEALRDRRGLDYWRAVLESCRPFDTATAWGETEHEPLEHDALGRRELFMRVGASLALAGLAGCGQRPRERILPYVTSPVEVLPGVPIQYATSMVTDGFAVGLLAKSFDGRPVKIEGNPLHPASLGAAGAHEQASILSLYDPSRLRGPLFAGAPAQWDAAFAALRGPSTWRPWFILGPHSSPTLSGWMERIRERYPQARFCFDAPLARTSSYRATQAVFGTPLELQYDFGASRVVLSLDADFCAQGPMCLRWARDFSARHRPHSSSGEMARLYMIEALFSPTGSVADHRLALRSSELPLAAAALLGELTADAGGRAALPGLEAFGAPPRVGLLPAADWLHALARDLSAQPGASIVIAGERQTFETHVLALALNAVLGNLGKTIKLSAPAVESALEGDTLETLIQAIAATEVDAVVILDGDPVFTAPPELELARRLAEVPLSAHLTYHRTQTSRVCQWVLPLSHYLESWGDARAYDGTLSYQQPLIDPLFPARSVLEVVAGIAGEPGLGGHALLEGHWRRELGAHFDEQWSARLARGIAENSAAPELRPAADWARALTLARSASLPPPVRAFELELRPGAAMYDGRYANNAWLLELPDPISKQSWGNALLMGSKDASELGVSTGQVVELAPQAQAVVRAPVLVVPGLARGTLGIDLGYGQEGNGTLSDGVGVNGYRLRPRSGWSREIALRVTADHETLALRPALASSDERRLAFVATASVYREHPDFTHAARGPQPTLLPMYEQPRTGPGAERRWAMTIDTTLCTGCSACVIACQAENNVPVVGKAEVLRAREMHWLRIDSYTAEADGERGVVHQPMACQHCEAAPCEYVCPVNATVHSPDGLNEMVYNRCIGTRFCSNNCPYKVRRFNWFEYTDSDPLSRLQRNPEVTVRERGVMEKCTYCVQRIRTAERNARIERRPMAAGEVVTACQQTCPTQAIQFGSLGDSGTKVVEWRNEPRAYSALHELGTRPRTQYLAKIVNDNPEIRRDRL